MQGPINMRIWCPRCGLQHIDQPKGDWTNPPHKSHKCEACSLIFRVADVCTNGVLKLETHGKEDTDFPVLDIHKRIALGLYPVPTLLGVKLSQSTYRRLLFPSENGWRQIGEVGKEDVARIVTYFGLEA